MAELGDVYEARICCVRGLQAALNVRHYLCVAVAGGGVSDLEFAGALDVLLAPLYKAILSGAANYRGVGVKRISPGPVTAEVSHTGNNGPGTVAGDPLPSQISGIITWSTGLAQRTRRGRSYIPFPAEADSDVLSVPSASYLTRMLAITDALRNDISVGTGANTATFSPVVYSRKLNSAAHITSGLAANRWATQRSRGPFGRTNPAPF